MSGPKSDRLRKLETEYHDLKQWLDLKLVPAKDIPLHEAEIKALETKILDEKKRLQSLKDGSDSEDYSVPRRSGGNKASYQDSNDMEMENSSRMTDAGLDMETETYGGGGGGNSSFDLYESSEEQNTETEEDDDPFSDKNRWKRGMLEEQDNSQW